MALEIKIILLYFKRSRNKSLLRSDINKTRAKIISINKNEKKKLTKYENLHADKIITHKSNVLKIF